MIDEKALKNAFKKVKVDISALNEGLKRHAIENEALKKNSHDWVVSILKRQDRLDQALQDLSNRINAIEGEQKIGLRPL